MYGQNERRIGVDGFNLSLEKGTGVATYARTLCRALVQLGCKVDLIYGLQIPSKSQAELREVRFFDRLANSHGGEPAKFLSKKWIRERKADFIRPSLVEIDITNRIDARSLSAHLPAFDRLFNVENLFRSAARRFRMTGKFTTIKMDEAPDVMHWTYPLPIKIDGAKNIYTLHDIVPLKLPHTTLDDKPYYYKLLKEIAEHADGICTVSEASKKDILSFFPEVKNKIYNTYQACDTNKKSYLRSEEDCCSEIEAEFGLTAQGYFIFFGSLEPKKNIGRIIEAFLASGSKRRLVIVGAMAWKSEKELRYLERGISTGRIIKVDYLPEDTLFALLRQARALLFPSLSEGFGLPVLEAMHCGTPTLISGEGSLPEIGGAASLEVSAYEVDSIKEGIRKLDQDDALCQTLRDVGYRQAEAFGMASYQQRLNDMYTSILSDSGKI
ncbi:glycosyltransferase family 1 protein [Neokomagataea tanensis]|uniref:Glycosyltransferase family 1 protein n=1 Tax=Neokomagataea tanensis TaxID=661191 RepID=A0A4Y6VBI2_9PROT|nr:glycosyltransferase family 1 protein [Neokomagataea tanensis]